MDCSDDAPPFPRGMKKSDDATDDADADDTDAADAAVLCSAVELDDAPAVAMTQLGCECCGWSLPFRILSRPLPGTEMSFSQMLSVFSAGRLLHAPQSLSMPRSESRFPFRW